MMAKGYAQTRFRSNTFYSELAGNGLVLSLNYEKQIMKKSGLGLHVGAGLGGEKPMIPMGIIYLLPIKTTKSYIETGAGITLGEEEMLDEVNSVSHSKTYIPAYIPSVGFRHHTGYGLMWKIIYSPVFIKYRTVPYLGGFSLGWMF